VFVFVAPFGCVPGQRISFDKEIGLGRRITKMQSRPVLESRLRISSFFPFYSTAFDGRLD
jgi:hypothetical protein